jgi:hypothetical protein
VRAFTDFVAAYVQSRRPRFVGSAEREAT